MELRSYDCGVVLKVQRSVGLAFRGNILYLAGRETCIRPFRTALHTCTFNREEN